MPHDPPPDHPAGTPKKSGFPTTSWTLVKRIQRGAPEDAQRALEEVCRAYWYPVYSWLRRNGQAQHDAEDLTQAFFMKLIEDQSINRAQMERGRLRAFLLGVLKRTLSDHYHRQHALKRGGAAQVISFEDQDAEARYKLEPADPRSPDAIFDRAWARRVLESAEAKLGEECTVAGDGEVFDSLREFLPLGDNATPYRKVAEKLKIEEGTLRLQIHRMRKRYRKHIEDEIAQTVSDPAEQKAELEHLMAALGR
ncbi:MAG: sigma-70 family RNA polymerase sigma factor [Verrucomicrobiaceae bacterium]|nr:sigma-70 family RNA polymerase sigma factor [Verrucomicrobiaceae bacterium]